MSGKSITPITDDIDRYLAEAESLKYGDQRRLLAVAQAATAQAQTRGEFHRYAQALTHQARAYAFLNQYEASLTCSLEVLALARNHGFFDVEARAVGIIAMNFLRCGIQEETKHLFEHQRELGEKLNDLEVQGMALNDLAVVYMAEGAPDSALDLLQKAVVVMPEHTHRGLDRSFVHLNFAFACIDTKQYDEAGKHAQHVLKMNALAVDAPTLISDAHLCIASIHLGKGELPEAYHQLELARTRLEAAQPGLYNDNIEELTAKLLLHEQRYAEAVQVWERMYEMALQRQELDFATNALNRIKDAYEHLNDPAGVTNVYKRLAEDIPRLQKRSTDLRFAVLRTVFTLDKAAMQAELQLSQQKNAILERISHEFRTPLTIIQNAAETIDHYGDRMTLEQRQKRLSGITEQVRWLTVMLEDIVELLKLDETAELPVVSEAFQLETLAQAALKNMEHYRLQTERVHFQIKPDAGSLLGAQKALETILSHLLTNAIKFSQDDVNVSLAYEKDELVMIVADQGIGIPPEEREAVFKPLARGSNLDEVTGNGLGLAIVAKLVEQLHGRIDLWSVTGEGTKVTVRIPLNAP